MDHKALIVIGENEGF